MDSESGNRRPKKTLANLGQHAKAAPSTPPDDLSIRSVEIPVPNIMDILRRNEPPKPISLRLERIRSESDDDLMKWLTTESEHPGRPLDEGTKMAITAELMRRQAARFERPAWWRDRNYLVGLVAAVGGVIAAAPIVWGWLTK